MLTFRKNFDTITAGLNKMVTDLKAYADQRSADAANADLEAQRLIKEAADADADAAKPRATADKIAALLS